MHEPASQLHAGFNASFWSGLSASDKALISAVAQGEDNNFMAEYNAKNGAALERLVNDQGVVVREFNDDVYAAFKQGSDEVYEEVRAHSALAAKIHDSTMNARKVVGEYIQLNDVAYTNKRNAAIS
jgi:TRAP-type mannitol/chloroaromatic compound transport system substrate-binding protein